MNSLGNIEVVTSVSTENGEETECDGNGCTIDKKTQQPKKLILKQKDKRR